MGRIAKVLVVTALMVVLMATIVSPAFAQSEGAPHGWGVKDEPDGAEGYCAPDQDRYTLKFRCNSKAR
jgi:hypothetical protein